MFNGPEGELPGVSTEPSVHIKLIRNKCTDLAIRDEASFPLELQIALLNGLKIFGVVKPRCLIICTN